VTEEDLVRTLETCFIWNSLRFCFLCVKTFVA